jgi:hypothetical protein
MSESFCKTAALFMARQLYSGAACYTTESFSGTPQTFLAARIPLSYTTGMNPAPTRFAFAEPGKLQLQPSPLCDRTILASRIIGS